MQPSVERELPRKTPCIFTLPCKWHSQINTTATKLTGHAENFAEAEIRGDEICPNTPREGQQNSTIYYPHRSPELQSLEKGATDGYVVFIR